MSLRTRLTIVTVVLVAAGLLVAGILTYQALSSSLLERVDQQLAAARGPAAAALRVDDHFGPGPGPLELLPPGTYVELRSAEGAIVGSRVFTFGGPGVEPPELPDGLPGSGDEPLGTSRTYTVESGDSLSKIGSKYGIPWKAIFDANRDIIKDPDLIHPGQELKIPI